MYLSGAGNRTEQVTTLWTNADSAAEDSGGDGGSWSATAVAVIVIVAVLAITAATAMYMHGKRSTATTEVQQRDTLYAGVQTVVNASFAPQSVTPHSLHTDGTTSWLN